MHVFRNVQQWTLLITYIGIACYISFVTILLGTTVSSTDNVACLFASPDATQICCTTWWTSFAIGVPSCVIMVMLLCKNIFIKQCIQMALLSWLLITVFFGDFYIFYNDTTWCTNKLLSLFGFGLLFQNNMALLLCCCMYICLEFAMWRQSVHNPPPPYVASSVV